MAEYLAVFMGTKFRIGERVRVSLQGGDGGAGAGDARPRGAAGVAAGGGPAGELRRAVPGAVEVPQGRDCKNQSTYHTRCIGKRKSDAAFRTALPSPASVSAPATARSARTKRTPAEAAPGAAIPGLSLHDHSPCPSSPPLVPQILQGKKNSLFRPPCSSS